MDLLVFGLLGAVFVAAIHIGILMYRVEKLEDKVRVLESRR